MTTAKRSCKTYLRWFANWFEFCTANPYIYAYMRSDFPIRALLRWTSLRYWRDAKYPGRRGTPHPSVDPHYPRVQGILYQDEPGESLDHTFFGNINTLAPVIYVKFTAITLKTECSSSAPYFTVPWLPGNQVISTFAETFDNGGW